MKIYIVDIILKWPLEQDLSNKVSIDLVALTSYIVKSKPTIMVKTSLGDTILPTGVVFKKILREDTRYYSFLMEDIKK